MAKTSIKPGAGAVSEEKPDATLTAPAQAGAVVPYSGDQANYDDGSRDQITPKLGLVNGTGKLATAFRAEFGKFVYAERLVLGSELLVIPLRLDKYFVECRRGGVKLKHTDEKAFFKTAKAANEAGYALDWNSNHPNQAEEAATLTFLVEGPAEDPSGDFFIEVPSLKKAFAPVTMSVRRGGYRNVFRQWKTAEDRAALRGGQLWHGVWKLTREECKSEEHDNSWVEPRTTPFARLTAEDIAAITAAAAKFGGRVASADTTAE